MHFPRKTVAAFLAVLLTVLASAGSSAGPAYEFEETRESHLEEVRTHVAATKALAKRTYFQGLCAMYVHWQLMAEGILLKYRSGDAWQEFDKYKNERVTDGGYLVEALSAEDYTLEEALREISRQGEEARRLMVCFRYGTGSLRYFGHVVYIHSVCEGAVYYSESYDGTVGGVKYKAGAPICVEISDFCEEYRSMRFSGIIHFYRAGEMWYPRSSDSVVAEEAASGAEYRASDYRLAKGYLHGFLDPEEEQLMLTDADGNGRINAADCWSIYRSVLSIG